jgi:hypothetical protein
MDNNWIVPYVTAMIIIAVLLDFLDALSARRSPSRSTATIANNLLLSATTLNHWSITFDYYFGTATRAPREPSTRPCTRSTRNRWAATAARHAPPTLHGASSRRTTRLPADFRSLPASDVDTSCTSSSATRTALVLLCSASPAALSVWLTSPCRRR